MRKFSGSEVQQRTRSVMNSQSWDYSFQHVPWRCKIVWIVLCFICWVIHLSVVACTKTKIAGDTSLMTYRGHSVLRTLIRCRFSPAFSTGQRYIYSGCAAGKVFSKKMSCKSLIWETTSREKKILLVYDVLTGTPAAILTGHSESVRDVSWHPYSMDIIDSAVKWPSP